METLKIYCCLVFLSLLSRKTSGKNCFQHTCSPNDSPVIKFPFRYLQDSHSYSCGYPGFNLACDTENSSKTVIELGSDADSDGEFLVRNINYVTQQILLYVEDDCLPRRLLSLNLSSTPFRGIHEKDYTFINCSAETFDRTGFHYIACLSTANYTVFATSSSILANMYSGCKVVKNVSVPIQSDVPEFEFSLLDKDLQLSWVEPACGECVARGGECGYKNDYLGETACHFPSKGISKGVRYVIIIGVGIPTFMCAVVICCYFCARYKLSSGPHRHLHVESAMVAPQPTIVIVGLDQPTIESYPKTILGESRRLPKPDDNTCPICLSEYKPKETLRTIPDCKHCFHTDCIDEWLRMNATCPLCRNSPLPQYHIT